MSLGLLSLLMASPCPFHAKGDLVLGDGDPIPHCLETVDGNLIVGSGTQLLNFPHLSDVTGRLEITVAGAGRARFPRLERIHGGLEIKARGVAELDLASLTHVFGPLGLDLDGAAQVRGLKELRRLNGGLWIFGGGQLKGLLPKLRHVSGTVFIQPGTDIYHLLPSLETVGGHLVLSNAHHTRIEGLAHLEEVSGGVYLFGGKELALPRLRQIGGTLAVRASKLGSLASIGVRGAKAGGLILRDNPLLAKWPEHLVLAPHTTEVRGSPLLVQESVQHLLKTTEPVNSP